MHTDMTARRPHKMNVDVRTTCENESVRMHMPANQLVAFLAFKCCAVRFGCVATIIRCVLHMEMVECSLCERLHNDSNFSLRNKVVLCNHRIIWNIIMVITHVLHLTWYVARNMPRARIIISIKRLFR